MIRIGSVLCVGVLFISLAHAAQKHPKPLFTIPDCPSPTCSVNVPADPPTITMKGPLHIYVPENGTVQLSVPGNIDLGGTTLNYSGGHLSSDSPVQIERDVPKKDER